MVFLKMKTNRERGNALIYVLIAIALFAALSMTLGRQTNTSEASSLSDEKAELYATQLISYAAQAKSAVDQMIFSGTDVADLDFVRPGEAGFEAGAMADKIKRVYHPDGGGLIAAQLPEEALDMVMVNNGAVPGWYMVHNVIDWAKTGAQDVILTAYPVNGKVCQKINEKVIGDAAMPLITDDEPYSYFIDASSPLVTDPSGLFNCTGCYKRSSLCIKDSNDGMYAFFTVLADQ